MTIRFEDILSLLPSYKEYDRYVATLCPYHDDSRPSLLVFRDGYYRCLACGRSGNYNSLERALKGWSPTSSIEERTDWTPTNLPSDLIELEQLSNVAHKMLMQYDDTLGWYLKDRCVFNRIQPQYLGYWNGWYTIPIFGWKKEFLGLVARAGQHVQDATGMRYNMPKGQGALLYIPDHYLVEEKDYLVCVYGMVDALALTELRLPVCTATAGKGSLHAAMLDWCRKRIIIVPDKGEEDTARKLAGGLGWRSTVLALDYPSSCKDPADVLKAGEGEWMISEIERRR